MPDKEPSKSPRNNYILVNDLAGQNDQLAESAHRYLSRKASEKIRELASKSVPPSEVLASFTPQLKDYLKYWYQQKGIPSGDLNLQSAFFVLPKEPDAKKDGRETAAKADSKSNTAVLFKAESGFQPEDPSFLYAEVINNFESMRAAAHEAYHLVAPAKLYVRGDEQRTFETDRYLGAAYESKRHKKKGNAIEEGLTVLFEFDAVKSIAAAHFPEGLYAYFGQMKAMMDRHPEFKQRMLDENIPIESVHLEIEDKGPSATIAYKNSVNLVKYLTEMVPQFRELVELLRVKDESLPLARALEKTFGKSTLGEGREGKSPFSFIMLAREENAEEVLVELKKRRELINS